MSRRYTASEKGKWVQSSSDQKRRTPILIPESDSSALIEENELTLIGRVTNPSVQKPQWVVEWLSQFWNLESAVQGRPLGPDLFSFKFESEEALATILRKSPYHNKRWMLILQRWEPVISNSFPSSILFWVRIHGVPLHYWLESTFQSIGEILGNIVEKDIPQGRLRIEINSLKQLEMKLPICIPSGEVMCVTLEYEKLEKHCFHCFSLLHEEKDCHRKPTEPTKLPSARGINQLNTIASLEEVRRRNLSRARELPQRRIEDSRRQDSSRYSHRKPAPHGRSLYSIYSRRCPSPRRTRDIETRLQYPYHGDSIRNVSREYNRPEDRTSNKERVASRLSVGSPSRPPPLKSRKDPSHPKQSTKQADHHEATPQDSQRIPKVTCTASPPSNPTEPKPPTLPLKTHQEN
ncbi:unnamed protein product [Thlaspi arvense]|uniref:DUF4283 domain-containing protein n=1 Tax=Thlaspi arvense TaxID=13288 RepID=A0AAU9RYY8_THLAR|nr:unnamed protein product [Thlaspi arvense]